MVPNPPLPPIYPHPHLTRTLSPTQANTTLSTYLTTSTTHPHLHPDSLLSATGITFSATSGPRGGLAIHHLQRIAQGLQGENLAIETKEELEARFGGGDDTRLDALIAETEEEMRGGRMGGKRKRERERDIEEWSSEVLQAPQEIESFANTPMHYGHEGWQEQGEYELEQEVLEGEVGERDGAPVVRQDGFVPEIVEHDEDGEVVRMKPRTKADKEARREAKKARKLEERRKLAEVGGKG